MNNRLREKLLELRERPTVANWYELWPELCERPSIETTRHNVQMVRSFVAEYGKRRLDSLDRIEARAWAASHRGNARYVKTFYSDAIKLGLCSENPFTGITFPSDGRKYKAALSIEEVLRAVETAENVHEGPWGRQFATMILTAGLCAVRLAEASKLRVEEFQIEDGLPVSVNVCAKETKRNRGRPYRKVAIIPRVRPRLAEIMPQSGLIFTTKTGKPHTRQSVNRAWQPVREKLGIDVDWHGLRHSAVTFYAESGADPWAIAWQVHGHDKPNMAVEVYSHARRDEALRRLELVTE